MTTLVPLRKTSPAKAFTTGFGGFGEFDRIFDNFFKNAVTNLDVSAPALTDMVLRMDIGETDKSYTVTAELPGVDGKDVEISLSDGVLEISGEKQSEEETKDKTFHRVERSYGSFRRSLKLPADADEKKIDAQMKNGVLEIEIGKIEEATKESRKIKIRS